MLPRLWNTTSALQATLAADSHSDKLTLVRQLFSLMFPTETLAHLYHLTGEEEFLTLSMDYDIPAFIDRNRLLRQSLFGRQSTRIVLSGPASA